MNADLAANQRLHLRYLASEPRFSGGNGNRDIQSSAGVRACFVLASGMR
jgi:hypothetical protein